MEVVKTNGESNVKQITDKIINNVGNIPEHRANWESTDCSCSKSILDEGDWNVPRPRFGAAGEINISLTTVQGINQESLKGNLNVSRYFNSVEHEKRYEFKLGGPETAVDRTLETSLMSFLEGERSTLTLRVFLDQKYNCKPKDSHEPLWITIEAEIHLIYLVNADPIYKWYPQTKLDRAKEIYQTAVGLFKLGRFLDSFHLFQVAHKLAVLSIGVKALPKPDTHREIPLGDSTALTRSVKDDTDLETAEEAKKLVLNCCNNLAACHFQWNNHISVLELSTTVLKSEPGQVKALYRRGLAYLATGEFDLAEKDLVMAHKADPTNRAVNEKLGQVKLRKKKETSELQTRMSKMFT